jgi:hypothetical protein
MWPSPSCGRRWQRRRRGCADLPRPSLPRPSPPLPQDNIRAISNASSTDEALLEALQALQGLVEPIDNANGGRRCLCLPRRPARPAQPVLCSCARRASSCRRAGWALRVCAGSWQRRELRCAPAAAPPPRDATPAEPAAWLVARPPLPPPPPPLLLLLQTSRPWAGWSRW